MSDLYCVPRVSGQLRAPTNVQGLTSGQFGWTLPHIPLDEACLLDVTSLSRLLLIALARTRLGGGGGGGLVWHKSSYLLTLWHKYRVYICSQDIRLAGYRKI